MIGYLKGRVMSVGRNYVIIDTGGVGYKVNTREGFKNDEVVEVFTHQYVREDALDLYGFGKLEDLETFELMLTVGGVGPRMAISIVDDLGKDKIIQAISTGDTTLFRTVSGVGQKLAAKIIIELKNKIAKGELPGSFFDGGDEVVEALKAFGLQRQEVMEILKDLPEKVDTAEDKIKFVLKNVKKNR
jgi:Holliday junction DNA helicase RuvA